MTTNTRYLRTLILPLLLLVAACGNEAEPAPEAAPEVADTVATPTAEAAAPAQKLNLNTATEEEFKTIPEVGDRMVHEFMEYRPYVSIQQFRREMGKYVDAEQIAGYEAYVFVPVDFNESDAATLDQLPGVDADEAAMLVEGRPYASREAFLQKLAEYASADEQAQAAHFMPAE